jgi:hypothetical protein
MDAPYPQAGLAVKPRISPSHNDNPCTPFTPTAVGQDPAQG